MGSAFSFAAEKQKREIWEAESIPNQVLIRPETDEFPEEKRKERRISRLAKEMLHNRITHLHFSLQIEESEMQQLWEQCKKAATLAYLVMTTDMTDTGPDLDY